MSFVFDDDEVVNVAQRKILDTTGSCIKGNDGPGIDVDLFCNITEPLIVESEQAPAPIPIVQDNKCVPAAHTIPASGPPAKVKFNNHADFMIQKASQMMKIYGFTLPADICSTPPFKNARATKMAKYIRIAGDTAFMEKHAHLSTKEFLAKTRKLRLPSYLPPVGDFYDNDIVPFNLSEDLFYMGQGLNRPYPLV
jgi:hypothetical protein